MSSDIVYTDAEMIDWIERSGFQVVPGPVNGDDIRLWAVIVPGLRYVIAHGETWREAVGLAITKDKTLGSL